MPMTDAELAVQIAQEAGQALRELRRLFGEVTDANRSEFKDAGDRAAQELLAARLSEHRPDDAVLSEEATDSDARLSADRVWIIDPLDGTAEFGRGRADWAVHVALWQRGVGSLGGLTDAAVAVPDRGDLWRTDQPVPPPVLPTDRPLRIVVSRSRPPADLPVLLAAVNADLIERGINAHGIEEANVGSVGAKVGELMAGRAEAYLHGGGLHEWDLAAPHACALAHDLVALGPEQAFNRMPPTVDSVLIVHPGVADVFAAHWSVTRG